MLTKMKGKLFLLVLALVAVITCASILLSSFVSDSNVVYADGETQGNNYDFNAAEYQTDEVARWGITDDGTLTEIVFKVHASNYDDRVYDSKGNVVSGFSGWHHNFPRDNYSVVVPANVTKVASNLKIYRQYYVWLSGNWTDHYINGSLVEYRYSDWHLFEIQSNSIGKNWSYEIGNIPIDLIKFSSNLTTINDNAFKEKNFENTKYDFYDCASIKTVGATPFASNSNDCIVAWPEVTPMLTSVGASAFKNMFIQSQSYVENEIFSAPALKTIGANAFEATDANGYNMAALKVVSLTDSLTTIGDYAFKNCTSLETFIVPESVTSLGKYVWDKCTRINSVVFEAHKLSEGSFQGCTALQTIDLSDEVTVIPKNCFASCSSLTNIDLSENVTRIEDSAFQSTIFINFVLPASCTYVGNDAFYNCAGMITLDLRNVEQIGDRAFAGCSLLEEVVIPATVTSIGKEVFKDNSTLNKVEYKQVSNALLAESMFENCYSLTTVIFDD